RPQPCQQNHPSHQVVQRENSQIQHQTSLSAPRRDKPQCADGVIGNLSHCGIHTTSGLTATSEIAIKWS
ncbi:hypothetical protein, partial [Roseiflexus sp.]